MECAGGLAYVEATRHSLFARDGAYPNLQHIVKVIIEHTTQHDVVRALFGVRRDGEQPALVLLAKELQRHLASRLHRPHLGIPEICTAAPSVSVRAIGEWQSW
jgi:hypothetical protein